MVNALALSTLISTAPASVANADASANAVAAAADKRTTECISNPPGAISGARLLNKVPNKLAASRWAPHGPSHSMMPEAQGQRDASGGLGFSRAVLISVRQAAARKSFRRTRISCQLESLGGWHRKRTLHHLRHMTEGHDQHQKNGDKCKTRHDAQRVALWHHPTPLTPAPPTSRNIGPECANGGGIRFA